MAGPETLEFAGNERLVVRRKLGAGGMGVVYEAFDTELATVVAVKVLPEVEPAALYRFKKEFRALSNIAHANLVSLYRLESSGNRWFFTMELVDGTSFLRYVRPPRDDAAVKPDAATEVAPSGTTIQDRASATTAEDAPAPSRTARLEPGPVRATPRLRTRDPLDAERLAAALPQLVRGVLALHKAGWLHRDLKPSNVLVSQEGRVVVCDFGLVAGTHHQSASAAWLASAAGSPSPVSSDPAATEAGHVVGTITYMSPEQAMGKPLTEASDWYSVGVMLYEALTGYIPADYTGPRVLDFKQVLTPVPPIELDAQVPPHLSKLCVELLHIDPARRPSGAEILEMLGHRDTGERTSADSSSPFVGRQHHLSSLHAAFDRACKGNPVTVLVQGTSGMGKSALVRRFLDELIRDGSAIVLEGRCYERESVPYKALDSLIDALTSHLLRLPADEIASVLPGDVPVLARLFPVMRRVPAVAAIAEDSGDLPDPREQRRHALQALRELLRRVASKRPLVLHIDDLQWGDVDSAVLLADLLGHTRAPVMLLASYRGEDAKTSRFLRIFLRRQDALAGAADADIHEVVVDALPPNEARDLALELLGRSDAVAEAQAETIVRESGGNAFFVHELARYLRRGDAARRGDHVTFHEVLAARLGELSAEARRLLEMIAVAGRPVQHRVAWRAAAIGSDVRSALNVLEAESLVRSTGARGEDRVESYHDRIREGVVASLAAAPLRGCHEALALALEAEEAASTEALVEHWLGAGKPERAAHHATAAAERAAAALAFDRAARLYRLSLEHVTLDEDAMRGLRTRLGEALHNAGRGAEAAEQFQLAAVGAPTQLQLDLHRRAGDALLRSGHVDEGLALLTSVLRTVGIEMPATPRRALVSLVWRRARIRLRGVGFRERPESEIEPEDLSRIDACWTLTSGLGLVDVIRGADFQTRHFLLALAAGEPYRIALGMALEGAFSASAGRKGWPRGERLLQQARSIAERVNNPHAIGLAIGSAGISHFLNGHWAAALDHCDRAVAILRQRCNGVTWELDTGSQFALSSLIMTGDLDEFSRRVPTLMQEADERGNRYQLIDLQCSHPNLYWLLRDEPENAARAVDDAMQLWPRDGFHLQHYYALHTRAQIDMYRGDGGRAHERVTELWNPLDRSMLFQVQYIMLEARFLRARAMLAAAACGGDRRTLLAEAGREAKQLERVRMPWVTPLARLIRAGIAALVGDPTRARDLLATAAAELRAQDMPMFAIAADHRRGRLLGADEGARLCERAIAWMRERGVQQPERLVDMLAPGF